MTTSHCFGCFWVHIKWNRKLNAGIDQHGRRWSNYANPKPDLEFLIPLMETMTDAMSMIFTLKIKKP